MDGDLELGDEKQPETADHQETLDFLKEKHVLIVQGTGFNWIAPDHFRIVYLPRVDELKTACGRLADFLAGYRQ